ncbi:MAG: FHA domain-containing protein [Nocardioidaceae bacterium]
MPFCTNCGRQNPDDARFCSQCGTPIVQPDDAAVADVPVDATATITFGAPAEKAAESSSDRALSPIDAAAVDALPAGHALLVVQRGPGAGNRFLLDLDMVTAGRHPESEIFLDDVTVSRRHAEFIRTGTDFAVRDVGSLNGTYVNRDRIDQVSLKDGDEVQIGKYRLVFYSGHVNG